MPTFLGERAVADDQLVPVLPRFSASTPAHVLVHASRHLPRRVALVRDHLVESLTRECSKH